MTHADSLQGRLMEGYQDLWEEHDGSGVQGYSRLTSVNVKEGLWQVAMRISENQQSRASGKVNSMRLGTGSLGLSNLVYGRTGKACEGNGTIPTPIDKVE